MLVDFNTIVRYATVAIPPVIGCLAVFFRIETQLASLRTDIQWLKTKAQERRATDHSHTHESD